MRPAYPSKAMPAAVTRLPKAVPVVKTRLSKAVPVDVTHLYVQGSIRCCDPRLSEVVLVSDIRLPKAMPVDMPRLSKAGSVSETRLSIDYSILVAVTRLYTVRALASVFRHIRTLRVFYQPSIDYYMTSGS